MREITKDVNNLSQSTSTHTFSNSQTSFTSDSQPRHRMHTKTSGRGRKGASQQRANVLLSLADRKGSKKRSSADDTMDDIFSQHEQTARLRYEDEARHRKLLLDLEERRLEFEKQKISSERSLARWKMWIDSVATLVQAGYTKADVEALAGDKPSLDG